MENSWLKSELPSGSKEKYWKKPNDGFLPLAATPFPPPRRHDVTSTTISQIQMHALENYPLNQDEDL